MSRFSARREVALGLGAYAVYLAVRAAVVNGRGRRRAARNAARVVALERRLGIHWEPALQRPLLRRPRLFAPIGVAYVALNVLVTVGWPLLLFCRRHQEFHRARSAVLLAILGACPVFLLFPCDPPRVVEGFVDPIKESGFDLDTGLIVRLYNPVAAFPSIHLAFAVVTASAVAGTAESAALRGLAQAYPGGVALAVLATANHYVVDVVAGSLLGAAAVRAARALS